MKSIVKCVMLPVCIALGHAGAWAQPKMDDNRMQRDIEVAENILSTLLRQQLDKRSFFLMEITGTYRQGYGLTFLIPPDYTLLPWTENFDVGGSFYPDGRGSGTVLFGNGNEPAANDNNSIKATNEEGQTNRERQKERINTIVNSQLRTTAGRMRNQNRDSLRDQSYAKVIEAAKQFLADYGDLITQLAHNERIIITNRGDENQFWFNGMNMQNRKNPFVTIEGLRSDITLLRQGKLSREQFIAKLKVTTTDSEEELRPDLELLSSIFNRLYRSDLSKSYFVQKNTYYERLKDFGVVYHMEAYSTHLDYYGNGFDMPTLGLRGLDAATRDQKVKELYPVFANSIKEDILEYGKTLRSLKDDESLIFNVKISRCKACAIPSWVEYSIKYNVLKDYNNGKITREAALNKFTEKKGDLQ